MAAKLTVEISAELERRIQAAAAAQGLSVADVVRTVLETYVEQTLPFERQQLLETEFLNSLFPVSPSN